MTTSRPSSKVLVVLPAYGEEKRLGPVVAALRAQSVPVLVVDDGSPDRTAAVAEEHGALVLRHHANQGKGAALDTGFQYARQHGYDAVITMDSDGQHDPAEVPKFIEAYARTGIPVLVGSRMADVAAMPLVRKWTNLFMSWLLSRLMKQYLPDTQCGFRLYRCDLLPLVAASSGRFAAESEILLRLAHRGVRMDSVRIRTIYGDETSKIHPVRDTFRFFGMLARYYREQRSKT